MLFRSLFRKTLEDAESLSVRVWTIRALGKLSEFIEPDEAPEIVRSGRFPRRRLRRGHG